MIEVRKTEIFAKWFGSLKDRRAKARIQARIDRMEMGNIGALAQLVKVLVNCVFSMAKAIGCISFSTLPLLLFFYQEATKALNNQTLLKL